MVSQKKLGPNRVKPCSLCPAPCAPLLTSLCLHPAHYVPFPFLDPHILVSTAHSLHPTPISCFNVFSLPTSCTLRSTPTIIFMYCSSPTPYSPPLTSLSQCPLLVCHTPYISFPFVSLPMSRSLRPAPYIPLPMSSRSRRPTLMSSSHILVPTTQSLHPDPYIPLLTSHSHISLPCFCYLHPAPNDHLQPSLSLHSDLHPTLYVLFPMSLALCPFPMTCYLCPVAYVQFPMPRSLSLSP